MKKLVLSFALLPATVFAQSKGDDPFKVIGFTPFSTEESKTIWEEGSLILGRQAECLRNGAIKYGGNQMGTVDMECIGQLQDANTSIFREPIASFMGYFGKPAYGYKGAGQSHTQGYIPPAMRNASNPKDKQDYPIHGLENLHCQLHTPHGLETSAAMDIEGFKREHFKIILTEKYSSSEYSKMINSKSANDAGFKFPKLDRATSTSALEKIGAAACKAFQKEVGDGHSKFTEYTPGFGGHNVIVYSKDLNSLSEALPYVMLSNQKVIMASQDLNQSNIGSSDNGADQLMNEVALPPYYDGNRGKNLVYGSSPLKRFHGTNEGPNGSAGMIAWQLCIEAQGPSTEYELPGSLPPLKDKGDDIVVNFENKNVGIFLPNNVISSFPLSVKNGKIDEENTKVNYEINSDGSVKLNINKEPHFYGPRNSNISKDEAKQMNDNASAMRIKANTFVQNVFNDPKKEIDISNTKFNILSCANKITNQPGFKNWDTNGNLVKQDGNDKISFEDLSRLRSEAQGIIIKKMLDKEKALLISELDQQIKNDKALLNTGNDNGTVKKRLAYLEAKMTKINATDFKDIQVNIIPCGTDGSMGPDPDFLNLEKKYKLNEQFPKMADYPSQSAYFTELDRVSYKYKKHDVETQLKEAKEFYSKLGDSETDQVLKSQYEKWIKKYEDILALKDHNPPYLKTPVNNPMYGQYNNKFPCDMNKVSDPLNCDLIEENNKQLVEFKVESLNMDLKLNDVEPDPNVIAGYEGKGDTIVYPGSGKMYYAAVTCNRKYVAPKNNENKKGKKCYSTTTGWEIPCSGSAGGVQR